MQAPAIVWFRRDLRLSDNFALQAAITSGRPIIPLFIHDEIAEEMGAAPKWRLGLGVAHFADTLSELGARLILRRGNALEVLSDIIRETGAYAVYWTRGYDPDSIARDKRVKAALIDAGVEARSFAGHVMFEPWSVETGQGGFYRVYSPFWRAVRGREVAEAPAPPTALNTPAEWPRSDMLSNWNMDAGMNRGAGVVANHVCVGEAAARDRLDQFIAHKVAGYKEDRDFTGLDATSGLSENLTYGEISPHACWRAGWRAVEDGKAGAEHFLKEVVWREFAYHLIYHSPEIVSQNWREGWDEFPWSEEEDDAVTRWKEGRTGEPFVDAAMREMYVTGTMHNRARMIVASYLTKHLLTHWRIGQAWFQDCLIDWDPASNAMGWQWVAGCGPDAAPYFRIFNPATQAEKFDGDGTYRRRWIYGWRGFETKTAQSYFDAIPRSWGLSQTDAYPDPVVDLGEGRKRALQAYENRPKAATG